VAAVDEGPSWGVVPDVATKKRKLGTAAEEFGVSDRFAVDLLVTCAAPGERMSSPELRESFARMLKVTGRRWPRNVLIPRVAGQDVCTSRLAREMKIFPYGRNVVAVVSAVMEKDRQDASRKRRAFARVKDPRREVKMARGVAKSAAPVTCKPPLGVKSTAPDPSKPLPVVPVQEQRLSSSPRTAETKAGRAEASMDISMDDYLLGGVSIFDAHIGRGLVGEFFFIRFLTWLVQDRRLGNCLLPRHLWRLGRSPWRLVWWGLRRTRGPSFAQRRDLFGRRR
jgi:hypothetical protein